MFMVYWTVMQGEQSTPHAKLFHSTAMGEALTFMEGLRKRRREGEDLQFITMASENPDHVGQLGVDVTGPDYHWKKRRR
jgi:hypothetical protein